MKVIDDLLDIATIRIEKSTFEEILYAVDRLIGMQQIEGFNCDKEYGLLKCLMGISKRQLGIKYKYDGTYGLRRV